MKNAYFLNDFRANHALRYQYHLLRLAYSNYYTTLSVMGQQKKALKIFKFKYRETEKKIRTNRWNSKIYTVFCFERTTTTRPRLYESPISASSPSPA